MSSANRKFWIRSLVITLAGVGAFVAAQFLVEAVKNDALSRGMINLYIALIILACLSIIYVYLYKARTANIEILRANAHIDLQRSILENHNQELEDFTIILGKLNQAVAIIGGDDKVRWINNAFYEMFGYTPEEVEGKQISSLIAGPDTDLEVIKEIDQKVFEEHVPVSVRILQYRKDHSTFWAQVSITPILSNDGELEKYIAVCSDVSLEHESEIKLTMSENNFRQIVSTIDDCFYLYNIEEKQYEFMSDNSKEVMGADPDFFYNGGKHTIEFVHPDDHELLFNANEMVDNGTPYDIEYRIFSEGRTRWIRERSFPITNENGETIRNSGICSDITEKKRVDEKLAEVYENNRLLAEIGLQITEELSISSIIEKIYDRVNQLMDAECFGIGIIDRPNQKIDFPLFIEGDQNFENISYALDDKYLANVCANKDINIIIDDASKDIKKYVDYDLNETVGEAPESIIYLPLRFKGAVVGVISVQSFRKHAYQEYQIQLLKSLANTIASALANAQLYESVEEMVKKRTEELQKRTLELEKSYEDIQLLSDIGIQIASSLNIDNIFFSLYENVNRLLDAAVFGVRIYHENERLVEYKYEIEKGVRDEPIFVSMDDKDNYTVWCIEHKKEILINDNQAEYRKYVNEIRVPQGEMPHSLLFCPMVADGRLIGVVTVQSFKKNAYSEHHLDLLRTLVAYTGSAIHNANLYESLELKVEERTEELARKNTEITQSINYAQRIQFATLTAQPDIEKLLPDSFVLYRPKDIVSGDFYRVDPIKANDGRDLVSFLVGDCTGHGVPGATLAILCSSLIKQALTDDNVNSAGEALDFTRKNLIDLFLRRESNSTLQDGMDVAFGVIDKESNTLHYSGAFRDCFIIRDGDLIHIKGDRQHVGYSDSQRPFETTTFQLEEGDSIYVTSDGYVDQFGGPHHRKLLMGRFLKAAAEAATLPAREQRVFFEDMLDEWQGDVEQTDDICMIGVNVNWN